MLTLRILTPESERVFRVTLSSPATPSITGAQLKYLYANAFSMGSTKEELDMCIDLQFCDLIGLTEMYWDGFCDWSVGMEGYRLVRKDRQGR